MGSILSLELFSFNFTLVQQKETSYFLMDSILIGISLIIIAIIIRILHNFIKRKKNIHSTWMPPPTMLVILCLFLMLVPAETKPKSRKFVRKVAKPIAKSSFPILSTTALYLGLDSIAKYIAEEPEFSSIFITILGTTSLIALLIIFKMALKIYQHFYPPNLTRNPPLEMREIQTIQNTLDEIVQRTAPPIRG